MAPPSPKRIPLLIASSVSQLVSEDNKTKFLEQPPPGFEKMQFLHKVTTDCVCSRTSMNHHHLQHQYSSPRIGRVSRGSGGRDRDKVMTSKGLRDRRVRLSVGAAVQVYDLQDRLGLDQPSKAVDWLINAAAGAISELGSVKDIRISVNEAQSEVAPHVHHPHPEPRNQELINLNDLIPEVELAHPPRGVNTKSHYSEKYLSNNVLKVDEDCDVDKINQIMEVEALPRGINTESHYSQMKLLNTIPNVDEDCDFDKINRMLLDDPFGAMNLLAASAGGVVSQVQQQQSSNRQAVAEAGFLKDLKETLFGKGSSNNHVLSLLRDDVSRGKINIALSELIKVKDQLSPPTIVPFITRTKSMVDTVTNLLLWRDQQNVDLNTLGATYGNLLGERQKLEKDYKTLVDSANSARDKMKVLELHISELEAGLQVLKTQLHSFRQAFSKVEEWKSASLSEAKIVARKMVSAAQDIRTKKAELKASNQHLNLALASLDELRRNIPF